MLMITTGTPIHLLKFEKDYKAGKIKLDDVIMTGDPEVPESLEFEIMLPLYDTYGDPTGDSHKFKVTVAGLVAFKQALNDEADVAVARADSLTEAFDAILAALDDIKTKKSTK